MPDPTRPVAGAPIDTDWGQQVHDRTFQPPGCRVRLAVGQTVASTYELLEIDTVVDDPGGWRSGDTLTVPTGRGGLFTISTLVSEVNGQDGFNTSVQVRINGTSVVRYVIQHDDGGALQTGGGTTLQELSAGDEIEWWIKRSGTVVTAKLEAGDVVMVGTSIGA